MAYQSWSVVFGEQPSAAKWNILGTNDAAFNSGGGVTPAGLQFGAIYRRQGNTTGDASWSTAGTSATDTSAKSVFIQVGSVSTSSGGDVTVTYPVAYNQIPLVFASQNDAAGSNSFAITTGPTTTTFAIKTINTAGTRTSETASWLAIGQ